MATHSSVLAWRIPGTGSLVGCHLWGRTESDTTERLSSSSSSNPGEGNGQPLGYSCLGNPMDREAWWATVHRVAKSQTQLKRLSMHAIFDKGAENTYWREHSLFSKWCWKTGYSFVKERNWTSLLQHLQKIMLKLG